MKRLGTVILALAIGGCAHMMDGEGGGWTNLSSVDQYDRIGDANWRMVDGAMVADRGIGYLITRKVYGDFQIKLEFYAESDTNSGVFIRCQDPKNPVGNNAESCYEVNIWDTRQKAEHGTGAIVDVAGVVPMPKAGGKWNTYDITAKGDHFVVVLNGVKTVDVRNGKHARGVIGLQHAAGVKDDKSPIKFRNVQIKEL